MTCDPPGVVTDLSRPADDRADARADDRADARADARADDNAAAAATTPGTPSRRRWLVALIELVLLVALGAVLWKRRADLGAALDLDAGHLLALYALNALAVPLRTVELAAVTRPLGVTLSTLESAALTQAATLLNYLPMQAGTLLRARVLKKHRSLSYARYIAVMSGLSITGIGTAAVAGLLVLLLQPPLPPDVRTTAWALFAAAAVLAAGFGLVPWQRLPWGARRLGQRLRELADGWHVLRTTPGLLPVVLATTFLTPVLLGLRYVACFDALSRDVPVASSLLLGAAVFAALPVNVTPGGIGVRELVGAAIGAAAGLGFAEVLAAVTLDRVVSLLFSLSVGGASVVVLRRRGLR